MIEVPYLYTTLYALKTIMYYENRRSINIDNLIKYREIILDNIIEDYNAREDHYTQEADQIYGDLIFQEVDDLEEIDNLIEEYPNLFYIEDNKLCVYDDITLDEISSLRKEVEVLPTRFYNAIYKKDVFNLIGINKIYEFQERFEKIGMEIEKEIEKEYMNNPNSLKIKLLLYKRFLFLVNVVANNKLYVDEFLNIPSDETVIVDEYYDYYQESPYIKNNEPYPIDNELYNRSEFYMDEVEEMNPIQLNIEDSYHYAIFGSKSIYDYKYNNYFTDMYMFNNFKTKDNISTEPLDYEDIEEIDISDIPNVYEVDFNIDNEQFNFYIVYIQKLNELIDNGCYELIRIKNRLLYLLDNINYCLYDQDKFNNEYEKAISYQVDEDTYEYFKNESMYYIEDIFLGKAGKILEKLIFVSTYYTLTKDIEIKEVLNRFKGYSNYENYSEVILGETIGHTLKKCKK